jgi:hypothetical protein
MLGGIDHLVIAVPDLGTAIARYTALGFSVVPGGRHPTGTHNALIALADGAYLELIAFYEPRPDHRWWRPLQRGGGLVDFCLRTSDLASDIAAFRAAGVDMDDPKPLSRVRPDGYQLEWRLGIPLEPFRGVAPFLIEDATPRAERVPAARIHPNGVTAVASVTVAVEAVEAVRKIYAQVLGAVGEAVEIAEWQATGVAFTTGGHRLQFLAPRPPGSPLAAWLRERGPSPYALSLAGAAKPGALDTAAALGARISLV